jgi:hypothetical protein
VYNLAIGLAICVVGLLCLVWADVNYWAGSFVAVAAVALMLLGLLKSYSAW